MSNALIDNDIIFKMARYSLILDLLAKRPYGADRFHILSAAKFMLEKKLRKLPPSRGIENALAELELILSDLNMLEPTDEEITLASEFEYIASKAGRELHGGESLLIAVLLVRQWDYLFTGDKRAIYAFETLIEEQIGTIANRVVCFEQLISYLLKQMPFSEIRGRICKELATDKAIENCFACRAPQDNIQSCLEGINSYIKDIRKKAPTVLIMDS